MTVWLALLAVAVASWLFRVSFVALVTGDRLPSQVSERLDAVGPAAFAALVVTDVLGEPGPALPGAVVALVAAGITARLTGSHLAAVVVAALAWWLVPPW